EASTSTAFPSVQPWKASLHFENSKGFGEWTIFISTRADRQLRQARRKDQKFLRIIVKKIKELSNGHFSNDNQKRLTGPNIGVPIFEAKMTNDSRLVYQVDCVADQSNNIEYQALRIFGIYTHSQLGQRLWDSVGRQLSSGGREYYQRCTFRNAPVAYANDKVILPATWPHQEPGLEDVVPLPELPSEDQEEALTIPNIKRFIPSWCKSRILFYCISILADLDVAHVFNLSSREQEIVDHTSSCYVLGRSGTGKTTTMLFKMFGIERTYQVVCHQDTLPKPRQIFVTQSRVLAIKVQEAFAKLIKSLSVEGRSKEEILALAKEKKVTETNALIDYDEEDWQSDLPTRFSMLEDDHFPMFVTFDQLCKLLEGDTLGVEDVIPYRRTFESGQLVTYQTFLDNYWPHFSQSLTKRLDPSLVFNEIMGVIKGSEESCNYSERFLDRNSYTSLSTRKQSTFSEKRSIIYDIFEQYTKRKRLLGDCDAPDRTHRLLQVLESRGIPGRRFDYIYVDEVQDDLLIDALLMRSLCRNPSGLFWAGDTAQTISVGSSFRFNDLKAFLFRVEQRRHEHNQVFDTLGLDKEKPKTFELTTNYRSHAGIVNCAHSVIELITRFWPDTIDVLAPEKGVVTGVKPIFFSGQNGDAVQYEQFLSSGSAGNYIELGAQQCILVRNEQAKDGLRKKVGDVGIIMTIYECKGLEFDDVLLLNFFEDSSVDASQWRVVLNALPVSELVKTARPQFDKSLHAGVCSELKFLYVAITRARKNLWIIDGSERGEPMRLLWTSRNQIQNYNPGTDVPHLAVSSSAEEWAGQGKILFQNKHYFQAKMCFERAKMQDEIAIANAYHLREEARAMSSSKHGKIKPESAFQQAAEAFHECALTAKSKRSAKETKAYFRNSAEAFQKAQLKLAAAEAWIEAEEYTIAAKLYREIGNFDEAVGVIKQYRKKMDETAVNSIFTVARLFYFKNNEIGKAKELFNSCDERLEFLEDYGLDEERSSLLESLGRTVEAAELHLREGCNSEAVRLFLKDSRQPDYNESSFERAKDCILQSLWNALGLGASIEVDESTMQLLSFAAELDPGRLDSTTRDELTMFRAMRSMQFAQIRQLSHKFLSQKNELAALRALDFLFTGFPNMRHMEAQEATETLELFSQYALLLRRVASSHEPCNDNDIRKLFGFRDSTESSTMVPARTFFYNKIIDSATTTAIRTNEEGILISNTELTKLFYHSLQSRLEDRINKENNSCRQAAVYTPVCLYHILLGGCHKEGCLRAHPAPDALTVEWYNVHVRLHLQQILILGQQWFGHELPDWRKEQRFVLHMPPLYMTNLSPTFRWWFSHLYETIFPPSFILGALSNVRSLSPEVHKAFQVVKYWIQDLLGERHSTPTPALLTMVFRMAHLNFCFDRDDAAKYIYLEPTLQVFKLTPAFILPETGDSIVVYMLESLHGEAVSSLSSGVLFVKHVMDAEIYFNVSALCDLCELLCGSFIVYLRKGFHNTTLPRSWILTQLDHFKASVAKDTGMLPTFLSALQQLLDTLSNGIGEHLLFESTDIGNLNTVRNIFISRICRMLSLIGHNINCPALRNDIVQIMTTVFQKNDFSRRLYFHYARVRQWEDVVYALRRSETPVAFQSNMDEMIMLIHDMDRDGEVSIKYGLCYVYYGREETIARALDRVSTIPLNSALRAKTPVLVPHTSIPDRAEHALQGEQAPGSGTDKQTYTEEDYGELPGDMVEVSTTEVSIDAVTISHSENMLSPSQDQIHAASVIQRAYRHALAHRRARAASVIQKAYRRVLAHRKIRAKGLDLARDKFFTSCLAQAQKMEWPYRHYRLLYLGSLPRILVCLEGIRRYAFSAKTDLKQHWAKKGGHENLEKIGEQRTTITGILKESEKLRKALDPTADVHRLRDLTLLRAYVCEIEELANRLPRESVLEIRDDLETAIESLKEKRPHKKQAMKPSLNVESDIDM
ncbi:hypothetical protein FISHEDRAFT_54171, partial [Fistulina hepatica ATCC 64428]